MNKLNVGSVGAKPFSPADLLPALWLKADAITGLADGAAVATWVDSSINGRNATQGTADNQPTYQTNEKNGLPVVRFDGSNDFLLTDTLAAIYSGNDKPLTAFAVMKYSAAPGGCPWGFRMDGFIQPIFELLGNATPAYQVFRRDNANASKSIITGTPTTAAFVIAAVVFTGALVSLYINGAQSGVNTDLDLGTVTFNRAAIGAIYNIGVGPTNVMAGDIGEEVFYDTALSAPNRQLVEAYLKAKWATP